MVPKESKTTKLCIFLQRISISSKKNAASKFENVAFLQWSCSLQIIKSSKSQVAKIRKLTKGTQHGFTRSSKSGPVRYRFPKYLLKKSGCHFENSNPKLLRIPANSGSNYASLCVHEHIRIYLIESKTYQTHFIPLKTDSCSSGSHILGVSHLPGSRSSSLL